MSLPRSVAEVLKSHVTLEVEGIDCTYLNVHQPRLQTDRGVASFFRFHRGEIFASSALMNPMSKSFIAQIVPIEVLDDSELRRGFDQIDAVIQRWIEKAKVPA